MWTNRYGIVIVLMLVLAVGCGGSKQATPAKTTTSTTATAQQPVPAPASKGMIAVSVLTQTNPFFNVIVDNLKEEKIDCVISPAVGGLVVGQECARLLGCRALFAERENGVMTLRRGFEINRDERVLVAEDVVTTGGSVKEVVELVKGAGAEIVGIGYIVDRSNGKRLFEEPAFPVFHMDVVTYTADKCPLCKENSPAVKPGSRNIK